MNGCLDQNFYKTCLLRTHQNNNKYFIKWTLKK